METIEIGSKVGAVVGRGGANIKRIEAETGANLTIPKDLEGPTVCQIRGEPEAAAKAGKLVRLYMEHGGPPPEATQTVDLLRCEARGFCGVVVVLLCCGVCCWCMCYMCCIPGMLHILYDTFVCSNGVFFKCTLAASLPHHPRLLSPSPHLPPNPPPNLSLPTPTLNLFSSTSTPPLPSSQRRVTIVIGKAGATIKRIQEASKASLAVGRANNNMVVTGSVAAVGAAVRMVNQLLADSDCTASVDLSADRGLPGAVLGKSGETIKRIQKESGARLDIKRQEGGSVIFCSISGTRTQVGAAQRAVMAIVAAETGPPPCGPGEKREAIDIDAAQVSVVIGRGGQSLATLNKKSGATVVVRSLAGGAKVFVVGGEEAVAKGVKEVNLLLKRWSDRNAQEKARAEKKVADAKAAEAGAAAGGASPEMFGMSNPMNGGKDSSEGRSFALSWADEAEADDDLDLEFVTPLKPVGGAKEDGELSEPRAETLAQKLAKSAAADGGKGTADWGAPQSRQTHTPSWGARKGFEDEGAPVVDMKPQPGAKKAPPPGMMGQGIDSSAKEAALSLLSGATGGPPGIPKHVAPAPGLEHARRHTATWGADADPALQKVLAAADAELNDSRRHTATWGAGGAAAAAAVAAGEPPRSPKKTGGGSPGGSPKRPPTHRGAPSSPRGGGGGGGGGGRQARATTGGGDGGAWPRGQKMMTPPAKKPLSKVEAPIAEAASAAPVVAAGPPKENPWGAPKE